jgi:hypothetical protein
MMKSKKPIPWSLHQSFTKTKTKIVKTQEKYSDCLQLSSEEFLFQRTFIKLSKEFLDLINFINEFNTSCSCYRRIISITFPLPIGNICPMCRRTM